jgi:hypothetical protein
MSHSWYLLSLFLHVLLVETYCIGPDGDLDFWCNMLQDAVEIREDLDCAAIDRYLNLWVFLVTPVVRQGDVTGILR